MKTKVGIVILAVVCAGLAIALVAIKKTTEEQRRESAAAMLDFSNQLVVASANLDELRQVNLKLTNDLAISGQQNLDLSNNLARVSDELSSTKSLFQSAQDKITDLVTHITDLNSLNQVLAERASSLSNTLANEIAGTRQKLAADETNNAFLTAELQKQMAQRADMEQKFNDVGQLRVQIKKVRDEQFIAQRLEWMRNGTDPSIMHKGGQLLTQHTPYTNAAPATPTHFDLSVEVGSDGSIHALTPTTNAPAH